jgi:hypothetical protein
MADPGQLKRLACAFGLAHHPGIHARRIIQ